jgi:hypothetical protein
MTRNDLGRYIRTAEQILMSLNCARALSVVILMRHGHWDDIANLGINPLDYNDPEVFFRSYQATRLLSKARWLPTTIDTRAVGVRKFQEAEEQCRLTNQVWGSYRLGKLNFLRDYERVFHTARRKIGTVLGSNLYKWTELCDFGPGADGSTARGLTSAYNKLITPGSVTLGAYPYLNVFAGLTRLGHVFLGNIETRRLSVDIARGNKVTFVSKNAKTDRPIAVEPRWNIWMQKGIGAYIRMRLKLFGVDLDKQEINQSRASLGSRTGKYATIDLASASDTVSKELVMALLPEPWLDILASLRSPAYQLNGEWKEYEKWSSMGNGYTFELESLLFWAICSSVSEDVTVYGDDLVVPTEAFESTVEVLDLCGFKTNVEKSYGQGPFRESCGSDSFLGVPVTPIYWKDYLDDLGTLTLVNQVSVLAQRLSYDNNRCRSLRAVWKDLVYKLPRQFQHRGPRTISTVVHDSSATWNLVRRKWGWDGVWLNVSVPVPRKYRYFDYNAAILSQHFQPSTDGYSVRDRYVWKKKTVFVPCGHDDIGLWV